MVIRDQNHDYLQSKSLKKKKKKSKIGVLENA